MPAGGSDWVLTDKDDSGRIFQKEGDGPWYFQKGVTIEITRKVHRTSVSLGAGALGTYSGMITCGVGNQVKTRTLPNGSRFVCRADRTRRIDEPSEYLQQIQVWQWLDDEDNAAEIESNQ